LRFTDIEERCKNIEEIRRQLEQQLADLKRLESEARQKNEKSRLLKELAEIRGEELPAEHGLDDLEKARKATETIENETKRLEKEIYEAMQDITLPIPLELPKVDSSGNASIPFEGGPYDHTVRFIATTMSSNVPLGLDKAQLHPDKVVITNVKDSASVIESLKILRDNLRRLARIALKVKDPDVERIAEYLHKSDYRDIWEAVKGRKSISYEEIFSDLNIAEAKGKKRVRNFFTNLEMQLEDKFPFIRTDSATYELSFFGSLVWKRYSDEYISQNTSISSQEVSSGTVVKKEEKKGEPKKASMPSLNKYLSNEDKELIYGKEEE
jgi:hypothetical protein